MMTMRQCSHKVDTERNQFFCSLLNSLGHYCPVHLFNGMKKKVETQKCNEACCGKQILTRVT